MSEEEKAELQRQKEEAERIKKEMEYFDYKTIHKYKEILGKYGDIYVNDAPNMTLTSSNSIAEIKCKKKVMGQRMTAELRKVAMFFLKKYPFDINTVYYKYPQKFDYYEYKFTAILGCASKSSQDILEKILLANALLDSVTRIYLVGEVALAALFSLGINVGKVERSDENTKEYEKMKEFFTKLFEKAVDKRVPIVLPVDFVASPKIEFEEEVKSESALDKIDAVGGQGTLQMTAGVGNKTHGTQQSRAQLSMDDDDMKSKIQKEVWKPTHWADKVVDKGMQKQIDLKTRIWQA